MINIIEFKKLLETAGDAYDKLKEIKELYLSNKYGFANDTTEAENAKELYKISNTALFQSFKGCIANPLYLSLVRDGLRISYLNDEGRKKEIEKINDEIKKKYDRFGLRVMQIASTGELENIVRYLVDLKVRKDYNILDLTKEFEKIVENWLKVASFIKTEHSKEYIEEEITRHIEQKDEIFFIFAYGRAIQATIEAIAELNIQKKFSGKYLFSGERSRNKANIEYYKCFFESTYS